MIIIHAYRMEPVIKKASPLFCQLILLGVIVINTGILIWVLAPSTCACLIRCWTLMLGIALIFSNILAKSFRIYKIFTSIRVRNNPLTNGYLIKYTLSILFFEVALLLVFTFVNGIPELIVVHDPRDYKNSYMSCRSQYTTFESLTLILILIYNAILIFATAILAYLIRNVEESYNESKHIALAAYSSTLLYIIILPIYFTVSEYTDHYVENRLLVQSIGLFCISFVILIFLFLPKLICLYKSVMVDGSVVIESTSMNQAGSNSNNRRHLASNVQANNSHDMSKSLFIRARSLPPQPFSSEDDNEHVE